MGDTYKVQGLGKSVSIVLHLTRFLTCLPLVLTLRGHTFKLYKSAFCTNIGKFAFLIELLKIGIVYNST